MKYLILLFAALVMWVGCSSTHPSSSGAYTSNVSGGNAYVLGSAYDYGLPPTNSEDIVRSYIDTSFKDPGSVKNLSILPPVRSILTVQPLSAAETYFQNTHQPAYRKVYCYKITFVCNAENNFGGFTGSKETFLYVRNGEVIDHYSP